MSLSRVSAAGGLLFVSVVLAVYFISTGSPPGSVGTSPDGAPACDIEALFRDTARLAQRIDPIQANHSLDETYDAAQIEALRAEASELIERLDAAERDSKHRASARTLAGALEQYAQGLAKLHDGTRDSDAEARLEGMAHLERGDLFRKNALDQYLDAGACQ